MGGRAIFYGSYFYNPNTWFSGILIVSISIFSRMGLWRLLCLFPNIEEVFSISFYTPISSPWFNMSPSFLPSLSFIYIKDFFGLILILSLYFLQTHFGVSSLSHPDN